MRRSARGNHRGVETRRVVTGRRGGGAGSGSAGCSVPAFRCTNLTASRMTK
jgi:hypothetical protein